MQFKTLRAALRQMTGPIILAAMLLCGTATATAEPVRLIFDTDMGNDVDDALALGVIHALQSRGDCELLAVTITKDNEWAAPYIDAVNTFYGRGDIPIGVVRQGATPEAGKFLPLANVKDGDRLRYPHDLMSGNDAPEATRLLRQVLAAQPDGSVVIAQVGFFTNLARLVASPPDDLSPLNGRELVARKVRLVSLMAGAFQPLEGKTHREYNVVMDLPAARAMTQDWPTPLVYSAYEIGIAIQFPAVSIEHDFDYVANHPLADAYRAYLPTPLPDRPNWDLTSVLYAIHPDRGYFDCSEPGAVRVDEEGVTHFEPQAGGNARYLIVRPEQVVRVGEALIQLASQPPQVQP